MNSINNLISALRCLPGIGPKSAQRMAYYILERGKDKGLQLSKALEDAINKTTNCKHCRAIAENEICHICADTRRDQSLLCVVETPIDVIALEQTNAYNGLYFVLMGHLSPIDGIGPNEIGINILQKRLNQGDISELILATNFTMEGEATAHYIANLVANNGKIKCTRIAHGVPMGGELEYLDGNTITKALFDRKAIAK
jgi:recombination protein RecR